MLNYVLEAVVRMAAHSQGQQRLIGRESCALGHSESALPEPPIDQNSSLSPGLLDDSLPRDRRGGCPNTDDLSAS